MTDTYQAVYDAVRSRLSNCDVGAAIRDATHLDGSHAIAIIQQEFCNVAAELTRPSVLYRPVLSNRGTLWTALYGGVIGHGDSPAAAMTNFDVEWNKALQA